MRRQSTGKTGSMTASSEGEQGFWPSYADMMSAVALILFFLMLLSYIQNLITGNNLQNTQEVLADTKSKLELTLSQVKDAEDELAIISLNLDEAKATLDKQQEDIAGQLALIDQQKALISEQENYVIAANEELLEMRGQMQSMAVLRLSILEQIRDNIASVMGDSSKVTVGENGNIILNEGVFFDTGSFELKPESKEVLNQLINVFTAFLSNKENTQYVDSILIAGHTDDVGTDESNRTLSSERANAVINYLLAPENGKLGQYASYFCTAGYGENRPVSSNGADAGRAQNRRIEISIILKDDSLMDIIEDYLKIDVPDTRSVVPSTDGSGKKG